METLSRLLNENAALVHLVGLSGILALSLIVTLQGLRLRQMRQQWKDLLTGSTGASLEAQLAEHLTERRRLQASVDALEQKAQTLEKKTSASVRYIGMVRYDAFADVGATQSWSLAFYDEQGNGAVISCLYGRTDCRVYSKILEGGKADRNLTGEEQAAIEAAARGNRTVVRA